MISTLPIWKYPRVSGQGTRMHDWWCFQFICVSPWNSWRLLRTNHYGLRETQTNFTYLLGTLDPCSRPSGWDTAAVKIKLIIIGNVARLLLKKYFRQLFLPKRPGSCLITNLGSRQSVTMDIRIRIRESLCNGSNLQLIFRPLDR